MLFYGQGWPKMNAPEITSDVMPMVAPFDPLAISGGVPVRTRPWPTYDKGDQIIGDEEVAAARRALSSRRLFRYDDRAYEMTEAGRLEVALGEFFGTRYALAVSSGTTALAVSLMAAGVCPGARVACPTFTFPATPSAIILAGAVPVLIEVDDQLHMDLTDLQSKIEHCDAVVVVHMRGFAADVDAVLEIARPRSLPVIEDAVPAMGASLRGRLLGTIGDVGAFSTQSAKTINTGEGGFILTNDAEIAANAAQLSGAYEGRSRDHVPDSTLEDLMLPLFGFRIDEVRAAIGRAQLGRLNSRVAAHLHNFRRANAQARQLDGIAVRKPVAQDALLGEALLFRVPNASPSEVSWFARALRAEGIQARAFGDSDDPNARAFWNWRFLFPAKDSEEVRDLFPRSAQHIGETIDIPLSALIEDADLHDLACALRRVTRAFVARG